MGRETFLIVLSSSFSLIFQSTPSVGRETLDMVIIHLVLIIISIHSLRGEGDYQHRRCRQSDCYNFNPLPPWGGRRCAVSKVHCLGCISIHSLRGEGDRFPDFAPILRSCISIHSLRGEGDDSIVNLKWFPISISIHSLRGEGDAQ